MRSVCTHLTLAETAVSASDASTAESRDTMLWRNCFFVLLLVSGIRAGPFSDGVLQFGLVLTLPEAGNADFRIPFFGDRTS